jgi:hypothetical protein
LPRNKQSYEKGHCEAKGSKGKDMREHLKKAYLTLVVKNKGNHDGETDFSSNGELVFAHAMRNYNKAHNLKLNATNKPQKMLRLLDEYSEGKEENKSKQAES